MTLFNTQTILATDLSSSFTQVISDLTADNNAKPSVTWMHVFFDGLTENTTGPKLTHNVVIPDDYLLREVVVVSGQLPAGTTVDIDNAAMIEPIEMVLTSSTGTVDQWPRYYLGSAGKPLQLLLKGSILTITAATTNSNLASHLQVSLGLITYLRRQ